MYDGSCLQCSRNQPGYVDPDIVAAKRIQFLQMIEAPDGLFREIRRNAKTLP